MPTRLRGRKWQVLRERARRANPLCVVCQQAGIIKAWQELDHIKPLHQGGTNDQDNLQGLCKEHHYEKTQTEQGNAFKPSIGADGVPLSSKHHWRV